VDRRRFLLTSLVGAFAVPRAARAQQAGKVYRVGQLIYGQRLAPDELERGPFRATLKELGWVEGRNISFEYRPTTIIQALETLAVELVTLKVDVILATWGPAARAAKQATSNIPIVMVAGGDPVAGGLVASLARPGGNVTGVTAINTELAGYRLGLVKQLVPRLSRLATMWNRTNPGNAEGMKQIESAAPSIGVTVMSLPVSGPDEFAKTFARMTTERADALWVHADAMLLANRGRIAELAAKHRLPSSFAFREHVEAGGLMSSSADWSALSRRAAVYVDKILKGAKPSDLPVEQPTKFALVINLKTAKTLGLTIPPSLLAQADQVIE
jgi:putative tryptophan/tyrosine transport system substrate-binding protein